MIVISNRYVRRQKSLIFLFPILFLFWKPGWSRQKAELPKEDRTRIAAAFSLGEAIERELWPGWGTAPFALMLITDDYEFLLRHPHATNNFDTLGFDAELNTRVLFRKRLFPTNLLATFPAINGISTIVVGQSANTNVSSSTAWVLSIIHEHFHQYQQSQPDYYASTEALGLSHGDQTGMWMLNYRFPYDSVDVGQAYSAMANALLDAIRCKPIDQPKYLKSFFSTRERFKLVLSSDDLKYFSFQCWQEGVARYTELKAAEIAATKFNAGKNFYSLKDFKPFSEVADSLRANILVQLADPSLAHLRRTAFYSLGAGEALLLDKIRPDWRQYYFRNRFHLEKNFSK